MKLIDVDGKKVYKKERINRKRLKMEKPTPMTNDLFQDSPSH